MTATTVQRRVINPWTWQDWLGYVQANEIRGAARCLICSGQAAVDADGHAVHPGDMEAQVHQALDNLETVLREAGFSLADVVRLNIYTTDVDQFFSVSGSFMRRLTAAGCHTASTLLGVSRLAFPELMVEIEATAMA